MTKYKWQGDTKITIPFENGNVYIRPGETFEMKNIPEQFESYLHNCMLERIDNNDRSDINEYEEPDIGLPDFATYQKMQQNKRYNTDNEEIDDEIVNDMNEGEY